MAEKVLISGGTGLLGKKITSILQAKGYEVSYLSRSKGNKNGIKCYQWDINKQEIEEEAITEADYIIHLAGASVYDKRWTDEYKKIIIESRTKSAALLYNTIKNTENHVKAFISASGISIYGDRGNELVDEDSEAADDFLAQVCVAWEDAAFKMQELDIRTVAIRVGIVLSEEGGAFPKLLMPIKLFVGAPLASGKQYMPWIHIDDLCNIFVKALEDEKMSGVYNGVSPHPLTNEALTKAIADKISRPVFPINVPGFALNIVLGEFAEVLTGGIRASSRKIENTGFKFTYPKINTALNNLLKDD
ncbi:TIGR01777 family oxidoreductase [Chondrinema litorale]|uniref:TIGR01777 family oxidoreductase n=1 Tax=Chondrinema litorale TaxID=2994555 RepID=UPI0025432065|nr:TIGR01777 family oxidoreductase [Chondrinema litorale]UZR92352.1 TIGR01777 family oxidoreductase [Chondrinema litorale]